MGFSSTGILVAVTAIQLVSAAVNNEPCETDGECSLTNQLCVGNNYFTASTCTKGRCACDTGYVWDTDKCKTEKYNTDTCVAATDKCMNGTVCSSGTCVCPTGSTYSTPFKNCLTDNKKLLGETCTQASDCYGITGTVKCDTTCQCETGYIESHYECKSPTFGQACVPVTSTPPGVYCASSISGDTSIEAPTCQSGTCKCPTTADETTNKHSGVSYTYCITTYTATYADGSTCLSHKKCVSKLCETCPGNSQKTCLRTASASRIVVSGLLYGIQLLFLRMFI